MADSPDTAKQDEDGLSPEYDFRSMRGVVRGDIRAWAKTLPVPAPVAAHAEWLKVREAEAWQRIEAMDFDTDAFIGWARKQAKGGA